MLVEFNINEGKTDEFTKVVADLSAAVQEAEPGARAYEWFLSEDGTKAHVFEWYTDETALQAHMTGSPIAEAIPKLLGLSTFGRFEVHGDVSDEVFNVVKGLGATRFAPAAGFSR